MAAVHSIKPTADTMQEYGQLFLADYEARHGGNSTHRSAYSPGIRPKGALCQRVFHTRIVELPGGKRGVLAMLFRHIQAPTS